MDETINEIMSLVAPLIAAELGVRVKQYLKDIVPGGVTPDEQIIKLTQEALHDLLDDIEGSISTDIDLAQANLETEIDNDSFVSNIIWETHQNDWDEEIDQRIAEIDKKETAPAEEIGGCCGCGPAEETETGPVSLDWDWDDITYK